MKSNDIISWEFAVEDLVDSVFIKKLFDITNKHLEDIK